MREREGRGDDIAERLLALAVAVVRLAEALPRRPIARHIGLQMVRSATSAGANYQEARYAESRADFVHKLGVAAKEMGETLYWVLLVRELAMVDDVSGLVREADELIAILVSSARTARSR
jgi:four helix bundle protein